MDYAVSHISDVYWTLAGDSASLAERLDCPTFGEPSAAVTAAWSKHLDEQRELYAFRLTWINKRGGETAIGYDRTVEAWQHWNRPSAIVRTDHADDPVIALARQSDGLADKLFGRPSSNLAFNASDLMNAPSIVEVLDHDMDPDNSLQVDYDYLYLLLQMSRSAGELGTLAQRVYLSHVRLIGQDIFDALIARRMTEEQRTWLFSYCKARHAFNSQAEKQPGYPLFEAVILASSLVRWAQFWASRGVGTFVYPKAPNQ